MAKVIVEKPRYGHDETHRPIRRGKPAQQFLARAEEYGQGLMDEESAHEPPSREGMRKPYKTANGGRVKELSENLNPLRRFLQKRVDQLWNNIYSELNEHVKVNNAVQAHVRQHLDGMVHLHVEVNEFGQIISGEGWRRQPLKKGDLYVDDKGYLRCLKKQPKGPKLDKGMKEYLIYRVRIHSNPTKDFYNSRLYYVCAFKIIEKNEYVRLGYSYHVIHNFRAGTFADAMKELKKAEDTRDYERKEWVP